MGDKDHKVCGLELMKQDDGTVVAKERRRKRRLWIRTGRPAASERANRYVLNAAWLGALLLCVVTIPTVCALFRPKPDAQTPLEQLNHVSFAVGDDGVIQVYRNDRKIKDIARTDDRYETVKEFLIDYDIPERVSSGGLTVVDDVDRARRSEAGGKSAKQRRSSATARGETDRQDILAPPRRSRE